MEREDINKQLTFRRPHGHGFRELATPQFDSRQLGKLLLWVPPPPLLLPHLPIIFQNKYTNSTVSLLKGTYIYKTQPLVIKHRRYWFFSQI